MKVISTNIAQPKSITWKGKIEQTGIYKLPENEIYLGTNNVLNDHVIDRKYHGGLDKACYLYSYDHYPYWKKKYSNLDWHYGMFGENITLEGFNEKDIYLGDEFKIGEAIIQISEPRLPCYKLGIRFNDNTIIKEFTNSSYCGAYARVIQNGNVKKDDILLKTKSGSNIKMSELYQLMTTDKSNQQLTQLALREEAISDAIKKKLL